LKQYIKKPGIARPPTGPRLFQRGSHSIRISNACIFVSSLSPLMRVAAHYHSGIKIGGKCLPSNKLLT
jgi:hypothetical protein